MANEYPKQMTHPHGRRPVIKPHVNADARSAPFAVSATRNEADFMPPVTVTSPTEEEMYRSRGYLATGETGAAPVGYAEYPKMLVHPDHIDAIPRVHDARRLPDGTVEQFVVPGVPEKFPSVFVKNKGEQDRWEAKGYAEPKGADPDAFERSAASPFDPDFVHNEYPKMVNGVLVHDPATPAGLQEYPKWVGDGVVNGPAEEAQARERLGLEPMAFRAPATVPTQTGADAGLIALVIRATKAGIDVQEGWTADQILDALMAPPKAAAPAPKSKGGRPRKTHGALLQQSEIAPEAEG